MYKSDRIFTALKKCTSLMKTSSNSMGTPAVLKTSLTPPISSGPTPSPGTSVTVCLPAGRDMGSVI